MADLKVVTDFSAKDNLSPTVDKLNSKMGGLTGTASKLNGLFAGALTVASIKMGFEFAKLGAQAQDVESAFNSMTKNLGVDGNKLVSDLQKVSKGTVRETELMKQSNQAMLLMGKDIASSLPGMMEIARAAAKATGQDVDFMFSSLVTGMGRGSKLMLDNLGIIVDIDKANEKYAKSLGKQASQLTETEKKQAFYNETLEKGRVIVKNVGTDTETAIDNYKQLETTLANLGENIGQIISVTITPAMKVLERYTASIGSLLKGDFKNAGKEALGGVKTFYSEMGKIYSGAIFKNKETGKQIIADTKATSEEEVEIAKNKAQELANVEKSKQDLIKQQQANTLADTGSFFGSMAEIAAMGGEQTLGIYKGLAIAQTIISSVAGAQAAMTTAMEFYGPAGVVLGPLMAAAQIAGGIARVAQISSTTTSSSSVSSTGSSSVSIPSAPTAINTASSNTAIEGGSGGGSGAILNINVTGAQFMSAGDFKTAINEIIQNAKSQGYDIQKLDTVGVVQ